MVDLNKKRRMSESKPKTEPMGGDIDKIEALGEGIGEAEGTEAAETADKAAPLIRRGSFRIGYKNEGKLMLLCAIAAVLCVLMFIAGIGIYGLPRDFLTFMGGVFWIIPAVVCVIIDLLVYNGKRCEYRCAETEMEMKTPKGTDYFYYSDIAEVIYKPITLFGKSRGFLVTIVTGVRDFTFRYLSEANLEVTTPEDSPFYILEVNAGLKKPLKIQPAHADLIMSQFESMVARQKDDRERKEEIKREMLHKFFDDR